MSATGGGAHVFMAAWFLPAAGVALFFNRQYLRRPTSRPPISPFPSQAHILLAG
jgi:hypothetical protein